MALSKEQINAYRSQYGIGDQAATKAPKPSFFAGAKQDLAQGFQNAVTAADEGIDRAVAAGQRETLAGRTMGRLGAGFRFAGEALGSIGEGVVRALPGGTTAVDTAEQVLGGAIQGVAETRAAEWVQQNYSKLPEPVRQTAGDVGNIAMGGAAIAGTLVAPGASTQLAKTTAGAVRNAGNLATDAARKVTANVAPDWKDVAKTPHNIEQRLATTYALRSADKVVEAEQQTAKAYADIADEYRKLKADLYEQSKVADLYENKNLTTSTPEQTLARLHVSPNHANGKFDTLKQADEVRKATEPYNELLNEYIQRLDRYGRLEPVDLKQMQNNSLQMLKKNKQIPDDQKEKIAKRIEQAYDAMVRERGPTISYEELQQIKKAHWNQTNFSKRDVDGSMENAKNYIIGSTARNQIERGMVKGGFEDAAQLNRDIGDIYNAADFLEALDSKRLPTPTWANSLPFAAAAASIPVAGPAGAVAGWWAGREAVNVVRSNVIAPWTTRALFDYYRAADPKSYEKLLRQMQEMDVQEAQLLLPAPGQAAIPMPSGGNASQAGVLQ